MAKHNYPVHIKEIATGDIYECTCYTTEEDALPITCNDTGSVWELKNQDVVCYIGLWPKEATNVPVKDPKDESELSINSPLTIKQGEAEYYVMRYVLNTVKVSIESTQHQTIHFTYHDIDNIEHTVDVTSESVSLEALAGTQYSVTVIADNGYTAGTVIGCEATGYISEAMNISVSSATVNAYLMTVIVPEGATITVGNTTYSAGTFNVSFNYGEQLKISCASVNSAQYLVENLSAGGNFLTSGDTYIMPANAVTVTCSSSIRYYTVTITQSSNQIITVTAGGNNYTSSFTASYGTNWTASVVADNNYYPGTLSAYSGTVTGPLTISASAVSAIISGDTFNMRSTNAGGNISVSGDTITATGSNILTYDSSTGTLKVTTK